MRATAEQIYGVERAYRDVFGRCSPSIADFPNDAIYELGLKALMRRSPVTHEELKVWISVNSPATKP
ncbi:MAG: hypothetical protein LHW56_08535 [Candidatus Cloacimonetes bacterium]|nr:hypothetical protein [Candidatus Cloacimonadota bacterium]MDY0172941.1 hypothetical protein [Candidatus Cloacimonadaceae bacterium]